MGTTEKATEKENWTEIIQPKRKLFEFNFRELWHYKDLLILFVKRDFASQYRQTILGPLWHIIQPLFTTAMFLIVFNKIAKIPTDNLPPVLFYICSITIWNYFSSCFVNTSTTFISNAGIFGKVYFPRLITPLSIVTSNIIKFFIQFLLLISLIIYYSLTGYYVVSLGWNNLVIPAIILCMACLGLGLGLIVSSLTTKYRDFNILISFGVQLLMYVTPVAYPMSYLEQSKYTYLIRFNPLSPLVEGFRFAVLGQGNFSLHDFTYSFIFMAVVLYVGVLLFNRIERSFMDTV